ncbi:MAG: hypothetical protein EOP34_03015 [Rickettsiales bacterium]|nr:MAG: hypothetical protein EOP34_03015 [Rickettsiales bacterium]
MENSFYISNYSRTYCTLFFISSVAYYLHGNSKKTETCIVYKNLMILMLVISHELYLFLKKKRTREHYILTIPLEYIGKKIYNRKKAYILIFLPFVILNIIENTKYYTLSQFSIKELIFAKLLIKYIFALVSFLVQYNKKNIKRTKYQSICMIGLMSIVLYSTYNTLDIDINNVKQIKNELFFIIISEIGSNVKNIFMKNTHLLKWGSYNFSIKTPPYVILTYVYSIYCVFQTIPTYFLTYETRTCSLENLIPESLFDLLLNLYVLWGCNIYDVHCNLFYIDIFVYLLIFKDYLIANFKIHTFFIVLSYVVFNICYMIFFRPGTSEYIFKDDPNVDNKLLNPSMMFKIECSNSSLFDVRKKLK